MFTGIISEIGRIESLEPRGEELALSIACRDVVTAARRGESIAVDGCCLTVETFSPSGFTCFCTPETMRRTSLGERTVGDGVNLERALALGDRLGGHLVSGHVDATGTFHSARPTGKAWEVWIHAPAPILAQCVSKGSIAVDGISLTIVDLSPEGFSLWIIPETWERTTLSRRSPGDRVNLETDLIGKYVFRYFETRSPGATDARLEDILARGNWGTR